MKVILVNNYFSNNGGADVYTYRLGNLLRDKGHEVFFFATDDKPYFEEDYPYARYFPKSVDYKLLSKKELLKYSISPFYNFEAEEKLETLIKLVKPDIVHCNCIFYTLTPSVLNACYKNDIPVVMTLHGPQLLCPGVKMMIKSEKYCEQGYCLSGNPIHCVLNKCVNKSFIKSTGIAVEYLFRKIHGLYNRISAFISPSQALINLSIKAGIDKNKLFLINNFMDKALYNIKPECSNNGYFLFVGRLSREKGLHYLLEAMRYVPDASLHVVGTGPDEEYFKNAASVYNLSNVEFLGFMKGLKLEEQYKGCIATVLPCNWFENFPTTIIESFAYGKPAIASAVGGIPELVENMKTGLTFKAGDVGELVTALKMLNRNPYLAMHLGNNGRLKAEKQYSSESYYKNLTQVYELAL